MHQQGSNEQAPAPDHGTMPHPQARPRAATASHQAAPSDAPPGIIISRPPGRAVPLVVASPHSGSLYPPEFLAASRLPPAALRRSEDVYVDEIFAPAPAHGATLIAASFPRAYCDVNREPWELDPAMFEDTLPAWVNTSSARVQAGLGTLPRVVGDGAAIYGHRLRFAEAEQRVATCWQPYHDALAGLLAEAQAQFGFCVLLDCHSMPARAIAGRHPVPDIVLGDGHGGSCAPHLTRLADSILTAQGFTVRRNDPYAGGYVTRHYGQPKRRVHALQIEICRGLYMNESTLAKTAGFARLQDMAAGLLAGLAAGLPALAPGG